MSVENLDKVIMKAIQYNINTIYLSGGEPLTHPDIYEIVSLIRQYPQVSFGILTNGILLDRKLMEKVELCGNIMIQISIDGSKKEIYEAIRGNGTFSRFQDGLNFLATSCIKDKRSRTAISRINYKDVENICMLNYEKNLKGSFLFVGKLGNAYLNWDELCINDVQKVHVNNVISNFNKQYGTNIKQITPVGGCGFSQQLERKNFMIGVDGEVSTCDYYTDTPIGNIFNESWKNILNGSVLNNIYNEALKRKEILENSAECVECGLKSECKYGCPGEAKYVTGTMYDGECNYRRLYCSCVWERLV